MHLDMGAQIFRFRFACLNAMKDGVVEVGSGFFGKRESAL